uniref:Uncharacterized protein n=1 Tax=Globisporangium ultimum (strain ATCC 200006 / CBS 805.95 / DAOM BR144) TaxID=431595 RepID=K3X1Z9_GLOUD
MGVCHSSCGGARSYELEYYNEAYRHQMRHRARTKLVDESLASSGEDTVATDVGIARKIEKKRKSVRGRQKFPTKLWMCEQGCCFIRWKLDYAEFQSYVNYAQVSPYVVIQDKTQSCVCVICKGLPDKALQQASDCSPKIKNPLKALLDTYESHHGPSVNASALIQQVTISPNSTTSPRTSEGSTTDEDDGSI